MIFCETIGSEVLKHFRNYHAGIIQKGNNRNTEKKTIPIGHSLAHERIQW